MPTLKLTRNQFASFLKDAEQIKQFEALFQVANGSVTVDTGTLDDGDYIYWDAATQTWVATQPDALTRVNDTNVTLTLGGLPGAALFNPVSITAGWTGTLSVPRGGSGAPSLTGYLVGNGIAPFTATATIPAGDITGTLGAGFGGTGQSTYTAGDMLYATGATTLAKLAIGANDYVLTSNGTAPGWTQNTGTGNVVRATLPQFTSTIGVGVAAHASGAGVSFPATQSASTDPNTLDDYEEGTYTPTVTAGSGTFTTVSATGIYTKIGRQVKVDADIVITTNGTAASFVNFTLPFTSGATFLYSGGGRSNTTGLMLQCFCNPASTTASVLTALNAYPGGDGTRLFVTLIYNV